MPDLNQPFVEIYEKRYQSLVTQWRNIRRSYHVDLIADFKQQANILRGEAGSLGLDELYKIATALDEHSCEIRENGFTSLVAEEIDKQLNKLIAAHHQATNPLLLDIDNQISNPPHKNKSLKIALVDSDVRSGSFTCKSLRSFSFDVEYFESIQGFAPFIDSGKFDLVLLDLVMPDTDEEAVFAFAVDCLKYNMRVISLSSQDDLDTRLRAVRSGINDYALKPININTLVSKIRHVCGLDVERPYKIVLLDDQPTIGEYFKRIAEQKGFELLSFSNATTFIRNLDVSIPDIFLLDINMPKVNGLEVARILRQESRFEFVPIVFLSADESLAAKLEALSAGGEDVISKSDSPEYIFKQIEHRVTRGQQIRSRAIKDGLTGLLNHGQLMESLSGFKRMAERLNTSFGLALLDLDDFKHINDSFGHTVGDSVLVGLAQLITRHVRETDIVGRYGGEEFLIAFQDVKQPSQIVAKLNQIRQAFASVSFETKTRPIKATFSCGFTISASDLSISELINRADQAMYAAKEQGKNRVVVDHLFAADS